MVTQLLSFVLRAAASGQAHDAEIGIDVQPLEWVTREEKRSPGFIRLNADSSRFQGFGIINQVVVAEYALRTRRYPPHCYADSATDHVTLEARKQGDKWLVQRLSRQPC